MTFDGVLCTETNDRAAVSAEQDLTAHMCRQILL